MVKMFSNQKLVSGSKAPDFSLKGSDGNVYSMKDLRSKAFLIVFMCNHCPYVKARIKDIVDLQSKFDSSQLQIIGINSNDSNYEGEGFDNMIKFSQEHSLNFPYLIDETQNVARDFGAVCTPDPFLFNENKELFFHGKINDANDPSAIPTYNTMEENIKKLLNGEFLEKDFDPSVGCSIKWKNNS